MEQSFKHLADAVRLPEGSRARFAGFPGQIVAALAI